MALQAAMRSAGNHRMRERAGRRAADREGRRARDGSRRGVPDLVVTDQQRLGWPPHFSPAKTRPKLGWNLTGSVGLGCTRTSLELIANTPEFRESSVSSRGWPFHSQRFRTCLPDSVTGRHRRRFAVAADLLLGFVVRFICVLGCENRTLWHPSVSPGGGCPLEAAMAGGENRCSWSG